MKVSHRGLIAIEGREGVRLKAYRDSKGLPTIGVGHLIVPGDGFSINSRITQEQCDELFAQDIQKYENGVSNAVKVPLTQNQFDALVSFCLNIGIGGFKGSTVVKRLNAKDYTGAAEAMMRWVKPPEITGRRQTEKKQFLTPYPNSVSTPKLVAPDTEQQPVIQNADTIVNAGDTPAPTPTGQDVTMNAPAAMGSVQGSTKITILGITIPAFLVAFFKMVGKWFEDGTLDVKNAFETVTQLIQQNFKYILILAGLVVAMIMLKKVERIVVFIVSMITHAMPGWNSVTVTAALPVPPKPWWKIW